MTWAHQPHAQAVTWAHQPHAQAVTWACHAGNDVHISCRQCCEHTMQRVLWKRHVGSAADILAMQGVPWTTMQRVYQPHKQCCGHTYQEGSAVDIPTMHAGSAMDILTTQGVPWTAKGFVAKPALVTSILVVRGARGQRKRVSQGTHEQGAKVGCMAGMCARSQGAKGVWSGT